MIFLGHLISRIMSGDHHMNPIVGIGPRGMVICLGNKGRSVLHEPHRFFESAEFEGFLKGLICCFPGSHKASQEFRLVLNRPLANIDETN
jgi:hypothetical protein